MYILICFLFKSYPCIKETQVYAKILNEELDKVMDVFDK